MKWDMFGKRVEVQYGFEGRGARLIRWLERRGFFKVAITISVMQDPRVL